MNYKVQRIDQDKRFYKSVSIEHVNVFCSLFDDSFQLFNRR